MGYLNYRVALPTGADEDADTKSRKISVSVDGTVARTDDLPITQADYAFSIQDTPDGSGRNVRLELSNIDNADNVSPPRAYELVTKDTIPPATPGEMTVVLESETPDVPEGSHPID